MTKISKSERDEALARLREWYPKGSTVYTILRHRSRSGMQRIIGLVALRAEDDGSIVDRHPNYAASVVLGMTADKNRDGIKVGGCGMDMGFHVVYELSGALYGDGYALKHRWL